jgi:hypothetical protein
MTFSASLSSGERVVTQPYAVDDITDRSATHMKRRDVACILILVVDVAYIAWGAAAAVSPDHLLGPGGKGILPAAYEGYSGGSWSDLAGTSPVIAGYIRRGEMWSWWTLLVGNTIALVSAITMDKVVNAIGPFELMEYLGLALVWGALAVTAPFRPSTRPLPGIS